MGLRVKPVHRLPNDLQCLLCTYHRLQLGRAVRTALNFTFAIYTTTHIWKVARILGKLMVSLHKKKQSLLDAVACVLFA